MDYLIHADGGSRGNPGHAAIGYTIEGPDMEKVLQGEYIGETTNNVAEYTAAIRGLQRLKALIGAERAKEARVRVQADSELMVKQMNREYKVKHPVLMKLYVQLNSACVDFGSVVFAHVRREKNKDADRMVNHALDARVVPRSDA